MSVKLQAYVIMHGRVVGDHVLTMGFEWLLF